MRRVLPWLALAACAPCESLVVADLGFLDPELSVDVDHWTGQWRRLSGEPVCVSQVRVRPEPGVPAVAAEVDGVRWVEIARDIPARADLFEPLCLHVADTLGVDAPAIFGGGEVDGLESRARLRFLEACGGGPFQWAGLTETLAALDQPVEAEPTVQAAWLAEHVWRGTPEDHHVVVRGTLFAQERTTFDVPQRGPRTTHHLLADHLVSFEAEALSVRLQDPRGSVRSWQLPEGSLPIDLGLGLWPEASTPQQLVIRADIGSGVVWTATLADDGTTSLSPSLRLGARPRGHSARVADVVLAPVTSESGVAGNLEVDLGDNVARFVPVNRVLDGLVAQGAGLATYRRRDDPAFAARTLRTSEPLLQRQTEVRLPSGEVAVLPGEPEVFGTVDAVWAWWPRDGGDLVARRDGPRLRMDRLEPPEAHPDATLFALSSAEDALLAAWQWRDGSRERLTVYTLQMLQ